MTGPNTSFDEQTTAARQFVDDAGRLWIAAAEQSDSAAGLGIDGRISLVHRLVDIGVKSYVAWLEAIIKGGGLLPPVQLGSPRPSEIIEVDGRDYPRRVAFDGPLSRIGLPEVTIQPPAIEAKPSLLLAGATELRIVLNDHRYIGSNFVGKLKLTPASGLKAAADEKVVTVAL